jgi:hypothetical protein
MTETKPTLTRQKMSEYNCIQFNNIGIVTTKLSDEDLQPIKDEIKEIQNNFANYDKYNKRLAGNIEHEYELNKTHRYIENLVLPYIMEHEKQFNYIQDVNVSSSDLHLGMYDPPWVNFMKKHEFNPPHTHAGIYSFVIWIDVPYDIEKEKSQNYCKDSNTSLPGHFQFIYINSLGKIAQYNIPVDKTYNNTMVIFPCGLTHAVYPFSTSDKYRISVSGNFKLIV